MAMQSLPWAGRQYSRVVKLQYSMIHLIDYVCEAKLLLRRVTLSFRLSHSGQKDMIRLAGTFL